jgi:hypothetical protein
MGASAISPGPNSGNWCGPVATVAAQGGTATVRTAAGVVAAAAPSPSAERASGMGDPAPRKTAWGKGTGKVEGTLAEMPVWARTAKFAVAAATSSSDAASACVRPSRASPAPSRCPQLAKLSGPAPCEAGGWLRAALPVPASAPAVDLVKLVGRMTLLPPRRWLHPSLLPVSQTGPSPRVGPRTSSPWPTSASTGHTR